MDFPIKLQHLRTKAKQIVLCILLCQTFLHQPCFVICQKESTTTTTESVLPELPQARNADGARTGTGNSSSEEPDNVRTNRKNGVQFEVDGTEALKLGNEFIPGLFPDYNLCKIFAPISYHNDAKYFVGASPSGETAKEARFVLIHKCRPASRQTLYNSFLRRAYECESRDFLPVS